MTEWKPWTVLTCCMDRGCHPNSRVDGAIFGREQKWRKVGGKRYLGSSFLNFIMMVLRIERCKGWTALCVFIICNYKHSLSKLWYLCSLYCKAKIIFYFNSKGNYLFRLWFQAWTVPLMFIVLYLRLPLKDKIQIIKDSMQCSLNTLHHNLYEYTVGWFSFQARKIMHQAYCVLIHIFDDELSIYFFQLSQLINAQRRRSSIKC